jgi:hypothetical protein
MFLFLSLLVTGCSSTNVSQLDPFNNYVGHTVELQRPADVVAAPSFWWDGSSDGVMAMHPAEFGLINSGEIMGRGEYGRVFLQLPVGHKVHIDCVRDEIVADEEQIIAYGHTTIPPATKEVRFAYPWGEFWDLWPAPWEPENTPEERGPGFKLPAHFDYDMFKPPPGTALWGTNKKP